MPKRHEKEMIEYFLKIIDERPVSEIVEQARKDGIEEKYNVNITGDTVRYIINKYDIKKEKYIHKKKYEREMVEYFKKIAIGKTKKEIVEQAKKDGIDKKYGVNINIRMVNYLEKEYGIKTQKRKNNRYSDEFIEYIKKIAVGRNANEIYKKAKEEKAGEKYRIKISLNIIRDVLLRYKIEHEQMQNKYTDEAIKEIIEICTETKTTKKALEVIKERKIEEKYGIEINERKINQIMYTRKVKRKKFYEVGEEKTSKDGVKFIKVQDEDGKMKYITKGRYVWEEKNGKLPDGMVVIHLDGDPTNDEIENLYPVKKETQSAMNANKLVFTDREKTKAGIMVAEIKRAKVSAQNKLKKRRKMKK